MDLNRMPDKEKTVSSFILCSSVLLFFLLMLFIPHTYDDWAWSTQNVSWVYTANGRYLGNALIFIISRAPLFMSLLMTASVLIPFIIFKAVDSSSVFLYLFLFFLLLTTPKAMFAQTIGWAAGFVNYVVSAIFTLGYLYLIRNLFLIEPSYSRKDVFCAFFLAYFGALCAEHVTLTNGAIALFVLVYGKISFKKFFKTHISYFLGACLGAATMFFNNTYLLVLLGRDWYRSSAVQQKTSSIVVPNLKQIYFYGIENNFILNLAIVFAITFLFVRYFKSIGKTKRTIAFICYLYCFAYSIYLVAVKIFAVFDGYESFWFVRLVISFVFVLCLIVIPFICLQCTRKSLKIVFPVLIALVSLAPLCIVTPIASRCCFFAYAMFLYYCANLMSEIQIFSKSFVCRTGVVILTVVASVYMTFICAQLHCFDLYRLQIIQEQIKNGENEAFLVSFPDFFRDYVWLSDPPHENGINAFKHFYHLKEDISLTIISYDEYLKLKK